MSTAVAVASMCVSGVSLCLSTAMVVDSRRHRKDIPFRCWVGLHRWYTDAALLSSVRRCNQCKAVDDPHAAAELAAERARIAALPPNPSFSEVFSAARNRSGGVL